MMQSELRWSSSPLSIIDAQLKSIGDDTPSN